VVVLFHHIYSLLPTQSYFIENQYVPSLSSAKNISELASEPALGPTITCHKAADHTKVNVLAEKFILVT